MLSRNESDTLEAQQMVMVYMNALVAIDDDHHVCDEETRINVHFSTLKIMHGVYTVSIYFSQPQFNL